MDGLAEGQEQVSMRAVVDSIGRRSFGPLLLIMGVVLFSPLSGIPGMAIFAGIFVMLIALQMLFGRSNFWLPAFILDRAVPQARLRKAIGWVTPTARRIDRLIKPRLDFMLHRTSTFLIAGLCVAVAAAYPCWSWCRSRRRLLGWRWQLWAWRWLHAMVCWY
ncbi:exopolysaccharide biosynthesis protein [Halopseudomonas pachastrellae]|nr:exopolysaccharide biosynthesis protein [Halopseudomonas pachastrellae]